jgi:hypothetical protein
MRNLQWWLSPGGRGYIAPTMMLVRVRARLWGWRGSCMAYAHEHHVPSFGVDDDVEEEQHAQGIVDKTGAASMPC